MLASGQKWQEAIGVALTSLLRDEGEIAIVLVEQYFDFAYGLADEIVVLNRGEVRLSEPAATVARERLLREVSI